MCLILLVQLQLAADYPVSVDEVNAIVNIDENGKTVSEANSQQVKMSFSGQQDDIVAFIEAATLVAPILSIKEMDMTLSESEEEDGIYGVTMVFDSYALPSQKVINASESLEVPEFTVADEQLLESLKLRKVYEFNPADVNFDENRNPFEFGR